MGGVTVPEGFDIDALAASRFSVRVKNRTRNSGFNRFLKIRQDQLRHHAAISDDDVKEIVDKEWHSMGQARRLFFRNLARLHFSFIPFRPTSINTFLI